LGEKILKNIKSKLRFSLSYFVTLLYFFIVISTFESCQPKKHGIIIALSKGSGSEHYEAYSKWLKRIDSTVEIIDFYKMTREKAIETLASCSGLILTGGADINPKYYGKAGDSSRCEIDFPRDTLEFELIRKAVELKLPVLCICRGEQIFNIAMGGTLIIDIPSDYKSNISHRCPDSDTCFHEVNIAPGSLLNKITGVTHGLVNTNHHQAVEHIAKDLMVTARSDDSLIEAYEWKDYNKKPFMLAVQWHPERLDNNNPLSNPIGKYFLERASRIH
jgi:putative glutamine amidotransferase